MGFTDYWNKHAAMFITPTAENRSVRRRREIS
jgi:hypothetical protein